MKSHTKTIEINLERVIPASVDEVFDSWLDPKIPGTLWNYASKLIFDPRVDGLFYVLVISNQRETAHYGRFLHIILAKQDIGGAGVVQVQEWIVLRHAIYREIVRDRWESVVGEVAEAGLCIHR